MAPLQLQQHPILQRHQQRLVINRDQEMRRMQRKRARRVSPAIVAILHVLHLERVPQQEIRREAQRVDDLPRGHDIDHQLIVTRSVREPHAIRLDRLGEVEPEDRPELPPRIVRLGEVDRRQREHLRILRDPPHDASRVALHGAVVDGGGAGEVLVLEEGVGAIWHGDDGRGGGHGAPFAGACVVGGEEDVGGGSVGFVPVEVQSRLFVEEAGRLVGHCVWGGGGRGGGVFFFERWLWLTALSCS